ncbi:hypothetical protein FQZ97_925530 [compost metagenome]
MVTLVHRRGAHARQVGAGGRLGHGHGEDGFATDDPRQETRLLLGVAVLGDVGATEGGMQRDHEARLVNVGQLLGHDLLVAEVLEAGATVLLVRPGQQEAHLPRLLPDTAVNHAGGFPLFLVRHYFLLQEGPEGVAEQVVLGFEMNALHEVGSLGLSRAAG